MTVLFFLLPLAAWILAGLFVVRSLRRRRSKATEDSDGASFRVLSIALIFDPDHALIWNTQMPALKLVGSAGPKGLSLRKLHKWYLDSAGHYPELYDGSTFKQWVAFLQESQLITSDKNKVVLMLQGERLLKCWLTQHPEFASSFTTSDKEYRS